jgi:hypothetical protein
MRRLAWLLLLAGCSSKDSTAPVTVSLEGIYAGSYTTTSAPGQGFNATLIMTETAPSRLEGTMSLPSGTLPLPFTGAYARSTVTLLVTAPPPYFAGGTARFAVSESGKHLVGTLLGTDGAFAGKTFSIDVERP